MSATIDACFVFNNLFEGVFNYDTKYNEFTFNVEEFSISNYPVNLRIIWYKCYPELLRRYNKDLSKVYDKTKLMNEIETDDLLQTIPISLLNPEDIKDRTFHKLFDQDAKFQSFTNESDRKHYEFSYAIKYDLPNFKGLNIDLYLRDKLISLKQATKFCDVIEMKYVIDWYNKIKNPSICYKRFSNDKLTSFEHCESITNDSDGENSLRISMANAILQNTKENGVITDDNLVKYGDLTYYKHFDLSNQTVAAIVIDRIHDTTKFDNYMTEITDEITKYPINEIVLSKLCKTFKLRKYYCLKITEINEQYTQKILEHNPTILTDLFIQAIELKRINHDNFVAKFNEHKEFFESKDPNERESDKCGLAIAWIKTYHEEPPFDIYVSPNVSYDKVTLSAAWSKHVNYSTTPIEMINMNYWHFMKRNGGEKRNPNHSILYTFFSNTLENKIIFTKSDVELSYPAVVRFVIPVEFDVLKPFLHEELITNDICTFAQVTKDDWEKIAGGRCDLNIVAFSEMKNIYRERTPLKEVLEYLTNSIELKFNVEIKANE